MYDKVIETANFIKKEGCFAPKIAIILGSGLGELVNHVEIIHEIHYEKIPHFPVSTVSGHDGKLVFAKIDGVEVLLMQGRFHFYEGYSMNEVTYPIFVMKMLKIEKLIVTNASGGINSDFNPGDLMLISDYINFMWTNPLIGKNDERFGVRFPDMSEAFSSKLREITKNTAENLNIPLKNGVYLGCTGPSYETSAEIRLFKTLGADAIGMSTVPETIIANYLEIEVLGISCITNMATGIQKFKHSHANVVEVAKKASQDMCKLVTTIVPML